MPAAEARCKGGCPHVAVPRPSPRRPCGGVCPREGIREGLYTRDSDAAFAAGRVLSPSSSDAGRWTLGEVKEEEAQCPSLQQGVWGMCQSPAAEEEESQVLLERIAPEDRLFRMKYPPRDVKKRAPHHIASK